MSGEWNDMRARAALRRIFDAAVRSADPRTAVPVTGVLGATVRAQSCILADALTKIVMALGEASMPLLAHYGASALFVSEHGVRITADWQGGVRLAA